MHKIDNNLLLAISQLSEDFIKKHHRPYQRYNFASEAFDARAAILLGPRGVGKTTLMVQKLLAWCPDKPRQRLFLPMDHALVSQCSLYEIIAAFFAEGVRFFCFDEVHKYPSWSKDLKSILDEFQELKVIASGSSAIEMSKAPRDLSRRAIITYMYGLSLREYLELSTGENFPLVSISELINGHEEIAAELLKKIGNRDILQEYKKYLRIGYYPYHIEYPTESLFFLTLKQSIDVTIESEIPAQRPKITASTTAKFKKLLNIIGSLPPFEMELKKLLQLTQIADERTLKSYLRDLELAGLVVSLTKKGAGLKALRKPDKLYLDNPNLLQAVTPGGAANIGVLRELYFICSLRVHYQVNLADKGDFIVDQKYVFEIGGSSKDSGQVKGVPNSFVVKDDIEVGRGSILPLWIFGLLY